MRTGGQWDAKLREREREVSARVVGQMPVLDYVVALSIAGGNDPLRENYFEEKRRSWPKQRTANSDAHTSRRVCSPPTPEP